MGDPLISSMVKWWFRLFTAGCISFLLGVLMFIRTGVMAGHMSQMAYVYGGVIYVLTVAVIVWIRRKVLTAPEMIEGFLRRIGLYKD